MRWNHARSCLRSASRIANVSPGPTLSIVGGRRMPPFTIAAAAVIICSGVTAMPWPKEVVSVLMSRHCFG